MVEEERRRVVAWPLLERPEEEPVSSPGTELVSKPKMVRIAAIIGGATATGATATTTATATEAPTVVIAGWASACGRVGPRRSRAEKVAVV